jgi:hypothetical protein
VSPAFTNAPAVTWIFHTIAFNSDLTLISAMSPARVCAAGGML